MSAMIPPWLAVMRGITGLTEDPGSGSNPRIMHMADVVAREYPEQATYASYYTGDDVAWCGLTVAYCVTLAGIEPVFGATDTERWMWALAWNEWPSIGGSCVRLAKPQLGCVMIKEREGGGHVTLYEGTDGSYYRCRGGNQSDQVNVSSYPKSDFVGFVWPTATPPPSLALDSDAIAWVQASLNHLEGAELELDGEMGPATRAAIAEFQDGSDLWATGLADKATVDAIIADLDKWNDGRGTEA
jgi:uncharacterized protein (TIGR02594 family)